MPDQLVLDQFQLLVSGQLVLGQLVPDQLVLDQLQLLVLGQLVLDLV